MPRVNRYIVAGQIYHVTHRCHNRRFLLRFQRDRDVYRRWLYAGLQRHAVSVLGHAVTSNHVHLLLRSETTEAIGELMQLVEGAAGQQYNRRKQRDSAFWGDRYHCTMIDSGEYPQKASRRCFAIGSSWTSRLTATIKTPGWLKRAERLTTDFGWVKIGSKAPNDG